MLAETFLKIHFSNIINDVFIIKLLAQYKIFKNKLFQLYTSQQDLYPV